MRTSSVPDMLRAQALDTQPLPPAWHHQATAYASAHRQDAILAALAHRSDSPCELVDTFLTSGSPKVRVALLTRPTLPEDRRAELLKGEKRASVLADTYAQLPPTGRELVRERFRQKPTRALAEAILIANDASDHSEGADTALEIVRTLSPRVSVLPELSLTRLRQLVRGLCATETGSLVEAVLPSVALTRVVLIQGGAWLTDEEAARLVPALFEPSDTSHIRSIRKSKSTPGILAGLTQAGALVNAEVRQRLNRLAGPEAALVEVWLRRHEELTPTVEELVQRTASGDQHAAVLLVKRTDAPLEVRVDAAHAASQEALIPLVPELDEPMRDEIAAYLFPYFSAATWASYPDPLEAQLRVLNLILRRGEGDPHARLNYFSHHATTACALVEAVGLSLVRHLPSKIALWRASYWAHTGMARLLAEAAAADLQEQDWAAYYSLIEDWGGTIGELHAACRALGT